MTNKLYTTIVSEVANNIQDTSSSMNTLIKGYVNDAYFEIMRRKNWDAIRSDYSFSTVAGTQDYVLPDDFGKEVYVYDSTNQTYLPYISIQELVETFPDSISTQGTAERYTILTDCVRSQPTAASIISVVSSSSADTTVSVRINGRDANGLAIAENVLLTGVSSAVTSNTYLTITSISKSASSIGSVTVTSNGGAVTIALIAIPILDYKVKKIRFHEIPSSVMTIKVPYHILPAPLSNDYDTPVFDCADGLELGAEMRAWRYKRQFQKAADVERLFEKWMVDVMWDEENGTNRTKSFNVKTYDRDDI